MFLRYISTLLSCEIYMKRKNSWFLDKQQILCAEISGVMCVLINSQIFQRYRALTRHLIKASQRSSFQPYDLIINIIRVMKNSDFQYFFPFVYTLRKVFLLPVFGLVSLFINVCAWNFKNEKTQLSMHVSRNR